MKIEIDINESLPPGAIVELHFKTLGMAWIQAAQIAAIETWLKYTQSAFEIVKSEVENTKVIFTVRVIKTNPVIITVAIIAAAIVAVGAVGWLTLEKAYQIIESPGSTMAFGSIGLIAIAVIAGLIINAVRK
jgi:hypothetical protein